MAFVDTKLKPEELAVGSGLCLEMGDDQVGIFHTRTGLFAINNACPHHGAPLHDGMMTDEYVTCPWHQWQFQFTNGACRNIPGARVSSYPLEVRDGTIWVDVAAQTKTP